MLILFLVLITELRELRIEIKNGLKYSVSTKQDYLLLYN